MADDWDVFGRDAPAVEISEEDRAAARLLNTPDGLALIDRLDGVYGRALPAEASDAALRYREGQRSVVQYLELLRDRLSNG